MNLCEPFNHVDLYYYLSHMLTIYHAESYLCPPLHCGVPVQGTLNQPTDSFLDNRMQDWSCQQGKRPSSLCVRANQDRSPQVLKLI